MTMMHAAAPVFPTASFTALAGATIALEQPGDRAAREALLDAAFGPSRWQKTCERLREGRLPARGLSLAASDGGRLIGTLRFWHVQAGDTPALMLGPLAVTADRRGEGLGSWLIGEGLSRARAAGHRAVLLVGDAPYYARFGFEARLVHDLALPGPVDRARFLGLELAEGALSCAMGRIVPTGARAMDCVPSEGVSIARAA